MDEPAISFSCPTFARHTVVHPRPGPRAFRERAVPSPAQVIRGPQRLSDQRRYDVPVTVVCTEFTSEMLRGWVAQGMAPVRELTKIHDVEYVDLPTGHWPQFTRPDELARAILRQP